MHEGVRTGHERWAAQALVSAWCGESFEQAMWLGLQEAPWGDREAGIAALQAIREGHPRQRVLSTWRQGCRDPAVERLAQAMEAWPDPERWVQTWLALAEGRARTRERWALGWWIGVGGALLASIWCP